MWDGNQQVIADVIDNQFYEADCYIRGTNLVAKYNFWNGKKSAYTYYTQNAHGDVVNLTDKDGKVTKSYKYDAFGVEKNIDKNDTNAFRYCGEYYDTESGTIYLRARYYDPVIGRFISRDSYPGKNEDPLSLNLYTYCENNPIWGIDPSGHFKLPNWVKKAAGAVKDFASSTVGKVVIGTAVIATAAIVTVATGGAAAGVAGYLAAGALNGAIAGAASGTVIGAASGAINHRMKTGSWTGAGKAALNGAVDGYMGGAIGGAVTGAAGNALKVGKAAKMWDKGTFKSGYQSMKYHYNKHAIKEGFSKGNNIVKYTKDAVNFANRNSSSLRLTYNYNYGNTSWFKSYTYGSGGNYNKAGKIVNFWYKNIKK